eukprot:163811-Karenia_brevis.AAC.1
MSQLMRAAKAVSGLSRVAKDSPGNDVRFRHTRIGRGPQCKRGSGGEPCARNPGTTTCGQ